MVDALPNVNLPGTRIYQSPSMIEGKAVMSLSLGHTCEELNDTWRINVSGRVYGPYSGHQIKSFAGEGRVAPHSIVQAGDAGPWITAIDDPVLAQLFVQEQPRLSPQSEKSPTTTPAVTREKTPRPRTETSNFVIIAELRGLGSNGLHAAMAKLGEFYRLTPTVWLLRSSRSPGTIRNELVPHISRTDRLFVVDAAQGRTAWFNLGPEADTQVRKLWHPGPENS